MDYERDDLRIDDGLQSIRVRIVSRSIAIPLHYRSTLLNFGVLCFGDIKGTNTSKQKLVRDTKKLELSWEGGSVLAEGRQ